jgi:hypothetical protein
MARSYDHIEHPAAYDNAVKASIYARANAKREREFAAAEPKLYEWLTWGWRNTEPAMVTHDGGRTYVNNPAARHPLGPAPTFGVKAVQEWGAPKGGAITKLKEIMVEREQRAAQRAEQYAAEKLTAKAWTAGRQDVEGVVISAKTQPGFAPHPRAIVADVLKILVKREDGSKIYMTCPRAVEDVYFAELEKGAPNVGTLQWIKGKRVRVTVTVETKDEDPTFAFGKRPTFLGFVEEPK